MKRKNSDRKFEARLRSGRKAIQYVRRKTEEMEREMEMSSYLAFPDLSSPMSFIESSLEDLKSDNASSSDLSE